MRVYHETFMTNYCQILPVYTHKSSLLSLKLVTFFPLHFLFYATLKKNYDFTIITGKFFHFQVALLTEYLKI